MGNNPDLSTWITILTGGGLVLIGVIISPIITLLIEIVKRRWVHEDEERARRITVRNQRLDQVELLLRAMIDDIFAAREQLKMLSDDVLSGKPHLVDGSSILGKRLERQRDVYGYAPVIESLQNPLIDEELNKINDLNNALWKHYNQGLSSYNSTFEFDGDAFMDIWEKNRLEINEHIAVVYAEIDRLRAKDPIAK